MYSNVIEFRLQFQSRPAEIYSAVAPSPWWAMEACAGEHHWGRELDKLGHTVRPIPPAYGLRIRIGCR